MLALKDSLAQRPRVPPARCAYASRESRCTCANTRCCSQQLRQGLSRSLLSFASHFIARLLILPEVSLHRSVSLARLQACCLTSEPFCRARSRSLPVLPLRPPPPVRPRHETPISFARSTTDQADFRSAICAGSDGVFDGGNGAVSKIDYHPPFLFPQGGEIWKAGQSYSASWYVLQLSFSCPLVERKAGVDSLSRMSQGAKLARRHPAAER